MNSRDQDLLVRAAALLRSDDLTSGTWAEQAEQWLKEYADTAPPGGRSGDSRWRDIDPTGSVATEPTPDPPDDPDEGETGPPEQELK